jgi:arsenate reductase
LIIAIPNALIPPLKPLVLILCTGNSCRSQMAEAYLREIAGDHLRVESAGSNPTGSVHPLAAQVLSEDGTDISKYRSKHLDEFLDQSVETVITVCGNADAACPTFPGQVRRYHWPFEDPAHATGTDAEILDCFRSVRDAVRQVFTAYGHGRLDEASQSNLSK